MQTLWFGVELPVKCFLPLLYVYSVNKLDVWPAFIIFLQIRCSAANYTSFFCTVFWLQTVLYLLNNGRIVSILWYKLLQLNSKMVKNTFLNSHYVLCRKSSGMLNKIWQYDNKHNEEQPRTEGFFGIWERSYSSTHTLYIECLSKETLWRHMTHPALSQIWTSDL